MNYKDIKKLSDEELLEILKDDKASEKDIILASIEKGERDYKKGNFYTTEEVLNRILAKNQVVRRSK